MEAVVRPGSRQLSLASRSSRVLVLITLCCIWSSTLAEVADTQPAKAEDANLYDNATLVVQNPTDRPMVLQSLFNVALDTIVFQVPSFTLLPAAWTYVSADTPYVLDRNFSILSQQAPPTVMDWSFLEKKVVMKPGTIFLFDNLVLMNTRRLDTFYFNWFVNSPGAVLTVYNSILLDPVCNASTPAEDLQSAQALPQVPQERRNLISTAAPFCLQLPSGTECFEHGVLMHALTVVVASTSRLNRNIATTPAQAAATAAAGNFVIQFRNTTRVCRRFLDPQCLQENGGNRTACWEQAAAPLVVGSGTTRSSMSPGVIAGAVIGGVVGLLLMLAAVLLLLRRRRHKHSYAVSGSLGSKAYSSSFPDTPGPHFDVQQHKPSLDSARMSKGLLEDTSGRGSLVQGSGRLSAGDQHVRASFGRDGLHLGPLLGAGSYGRVYKGRWHGQDVAIKIIHCLPEELQRVLREAEIMLQLDHPNVVRALNCILQHKPGAKADAQPNSGSLSDSHRSQARHSSGGGSSGSSRKRSTFNTISQMLPVLRKTGSANSSDSKPQSPPARAAATAGAGLPDSAAAAADEQLVSKQQRQQQQGHNSVAAQQELHVLPVLTTGSEVARTSGSTPDRAFQQQQQQQQQRQGLDPELAEESGQEEIAEVWLVLELCTGGNLQDSFRQRNDAFDLARLLCRLAEVAQGMAYLHSRQIMHGDLKSANVLLVNSIHGSFGQIAKLTDFGLAGVLRDGLTHNSTQHLGTISHCAPEVLQNGQVSPAADVYAFGIMMWELYTSTTAFKDLHYGTIIQRVVLGGHRPPISPDCPEDYALLMESCWNTNPAERPTFEQILECLTIMIHSLDAVTCTSPTGNVLTRSPRPSMEKAGTAAGVAGVVGAVADVQPLSNSRKVGSFNMCRVSSVGSSQLAASLSLGTSSSVGPSKLQQAASASSEQCRSASTAAAPAATVAAAAGRTAGGAGNGTQGSVGAQHNMGTWYVRKEPAAVAAGVTAAAGGCSGAAAGGSAGSSASAGSSKLSQLQPPRSRHIQDLW